MQDRYRCFSVPFLARPSFSPIPNTSFFLPKLPGLAIACLLVGALLLCPFEGIFVQHESRPPCSLVCVSEKQLSFSSLRSIHLRSPPHFDSFFFLFLSPYFMHMDCRSWYPLRKGGTLFSTCRRLPETPPPPSQAVGGSFGRIQLQSLGL